MERDPGDRVEVGNDKLTNGVRFNLDHSTPFAAASRDTTGIKFCALSVWL